MSHSDCNQAFLGVGNSDIYSGTSHHAKIGMRYVEGLAVGHEDPERFERAAVQMFPNILGSHGGSL